MKNLFLLLCFTFSFFQLNAQDALIYQFQNSPIHLSPTFSGTACGSRLVANYQNQWSSVLGDNAFHTASLSFDKPINLKNGDKILSLIHI